MHGQLPEGRDAHQIEGVDDDAQQQRSQHDPRNRARAAEDVHTPDDRRRDGLKLEACGGIALR